MKPLNNVKLCALEIINLIDNGDLTQNETYGKIGDKIENLYNLRLEIIKIPYFNKEQKNEK